MKYFSIIIILLSLLSAKSSFAGPADIFYYDSKTITSELATLDEVTQYVDQNRVTYSELSHFNKRLSSRLHYYETSVFGIRLMDNVLGIKSIYWGCCLGVVGVGVVFLATGDLDETKKSFYGCVISTILWGGGLLLR